MSWGVNSYLYDICSILDVEPYPCEESLSRSSSEDMLSLVFVYSGDFSERVIRNLINDPSFCKSCGLYCDSCKYSSYSYVRNIRAAIELKASSDLPAFVDDPNRFMPQKMPKADLCISSGLHKDLLLELPIKLAEFGVEGLIVPIEDFVEVPSGLRKQVEEKCEELGLECAFPKPFCSLEPSEGKPLVSRLVRELKIGKPALNISVTGNGKREVIEAAIVERSAPCGSSWYVAKSLTGVATARETLYDAVARAHHSYPCTATMSIDPEAKEPILHMGGYIVREAVEKALERADHA